MEEVNCNISVIGYIFTSVNLLLMRNMHFRVESIDAKVLSTACAVEDLSIVRGRRPLTALERLRCGVEITF